MKNWRSRRCACGCGELCKPGNRFLHGHNCKINPPNPAKIRPDKTLCLCGCGNLAPVYKKFIHGHNSNGELNPMKNKLNRDKLRQTMMRKYGVENTMQIPHIAAEVVRKRRENHSHYHGDLDEAGIQALKERCSAAGKIGGPIRARQWKENPEDFNKFLASSKTPEARAKYSGENHPCWNNWASFKPYPHTFNKKLKNFVKERDNNQCKNPYCHRTSSELVPHHIDYNKDNCIPNNLITLCRSCNARANYNKQYWQDLYAQIVSKGEGNEEESHLHRTIEKPFIRAFSRLGRTISK